MLYDLNLRTTGIVVGLLLIALHLYALLKPQQVTHWLRLLPRSYTAGAILTTIAFLWCFILMATMDLGEMAHLRRWLLIALPIGYFLTLRFVDDFLAVRAIAILLLLAADTLLCAAFLRPEPGRLLLVLLAYAWIIKGLFYAGIPHLMRDGIQWVTAQPFRWRAATLLGTAYGFALLLTSLTTFAR